MTFCTTPDLTEHIKFHNSFIFFCLGSIACVVGLTVYAHSLTKEDVLGKNTLYTWGLMFGFNALAMAAGILYLCKGYSKGAAPVYKIFLVFAALGVVATFCSNIFGLKGNTAGTDLAVGSNALFITRMVLQWVKIILLLVLAFAKDLGKRKSWIVFWVLMGAEILLICMSMLGEALASYLGALLVTFTTRLLMDGTIGLALKGKYDDKDTRGTT